MEKELNVIFGKNNINFFYENFSFDINTLNEYERSLSHLLKSISFFKDDVLKLSAFSINVNIVVCNDAYIQQLNSEHRQKPTITDVLSFPLQENIRVGEFDRFVPELELGDLYICHSVCEKQAQEFSLTFHEEFLHLCVHGFLHLCGFDHEENEVEEKIMEEYEKEIVSNISMSKKGDSPYK